MRNRAAIGLAIFAFVAGGELAIAEDSPHKFGIVVHGGVNGGVAAPGQPAYCEHDQYEADDGPRVSERLAAAVNAGYGVLETGGSATDAVAAAIVVLEDSPLFNAGKGAIETDRGTIEMDAGVMDGATLDVAAVAGVTRLRNPIKGALALLRAHREVLMDGEGAEAVVQSLDPETRMEAPAYFREHRNCTPGAPPTAVHGTVGAVALDKQGRLAAAASTGGYMGKRAGRIGDSPIAGAGIYADANVALASSGMGEQFLRHTITRTAAARIAYLKEPAPAAVAHAFDEAYAVDGLKNVEPNAACLRPNAPDPVCPEVMKILKRYGGLGIGGVIGIDREGDVFDYLRFWAFARGYRTSADSAPIVRLDGPIDALR
jgi:L-asparaginase / beta-aspartyl-peptidase